MRSPTPYLQSTSSARHCCGALHAFPPKLYSPQHTVFAYSLCSVACLRPLSPTHARQCHTGVLERVLERKSLTKSLTKR